ncbi:MAG: hypothetical protein V3T77_08325 [Planctomycetota bacterium]
MSGYPKIERPDRIMVPLLVFLFVIPFFTMTCTVADSSPPFRPLDRGTFSISIVEVMEGHVTEQNIAQQLITRLMIQHGFHLAKKPEEARYRIEGTLDCTFHKKLNFEYEEQKVHLEHQYKADFRCILSDRGEDPDRRKGEGTAKPVVEEFHIPELINGRIDQRDAKRDIRRRAGTIMAQRLVSERLLGEPKIKGLIDALGDAYDPRTFNQVVEELTARGAEAIPYLLDTLRDERPVRLSGEYPDLKEWNKDSLRYYHIADLALSEILGRTSGLAIDSSEEYRLRVSLAWTWAWEDLQGIPQVHRTQPERRKRTVPATAAQKN